MNRINAAIVYLKSRDIKATQKQVALQSGLSIRTVKTYWHHRNTNFDEWYTALFKKIHQIKIDKSKTRIAIRKLRQENDSLREQNRVLALKALGLVAI